MFNMVKLHKLSWTNSDKEKSVKYFFSEEDMAEYMRSNNIKSGWSTRLVCALIFNQLHPSQTES
ncbi:MAG: hypothetical protein A3J76_01160 [Candidatus Moranbacteria bacterium RBG_13_45_13]|nr:MAG: hypothetical protein A3J76_01160 [Candidatus Moranbacteria bacterium RBG_13_45_13]